MVLRPLLRSETACASYLLGCTSYDMLAVVDPHVALVDSCLAAAREIGSPIVAVFETHVRADHVSGLLADGEVVEPGNTIVRAIATPWRSDPDTARAGSAAFAEPA